MRGIKEETFQKLANSIKKNLGRLFQNKEESRPGFFGIGIIEASLNKNGNRHSQKETVGIRANVSSENR